MKTHLNQLPYQVRCTISLATKISHALTPKTFCKPTPLTSLRDVGVCSGRAVVTHYFSPIMDFGRQVSESNNCCIIRK